MSSTKSETYQLVRQHYGDALAVEMEGYRFHSALYAYPNIQYLAVRGISDLVDDKAASDASGSQELASATAAAFVFALLAEIKTAQESVSGNMIAEQPQRDTVFWEDLLALVEKLYPEGPEQLNVWERAGGEKSRLNLRQPGIAIWFQALQLLRNGGGQGITKHTLLQKISSDFPGRPEIQILFKLA